MRYKIIIEDISYCRNCGSLEPCTPIYIENGCHCCLGCALTGCYITQEEYKQACIDCVPKKIKYFEERIKSLKLVETVEPIWSDFTNQL